MAHLYSLADLFSAAASDVTVTRKNVEIDNGQKATVKATVKPSVARDTAQDGINQLHAIGKLAPLKTGKVHLDTCADGSNGLDVYLSKLFKEAE